MSCCVAGDNKTRRVRVGAVEVCIHSAKRSGTNYDKKGGSMALRLLSCEQSSKEQRLRRKLYGKSGTKGQGNGAKWTEVWLQWFNRLPPSKEMGE